MSKKNKAKTAKVEVAQITAPVTETTVPEIVQVEKKVKPTITAATLVLPEGVEMKILGSCVKFIKGEVKAYLKGRSLEINRIQTALVDKIKEFTTEQKDKCHLGSSLGLIPSISDNVELEKILAKYFKGVKIATPKAAKVEVAPVVPETAIQTA